MSGVFQHSSFSPPTTGSRRGLCSDIYCGNLTELLEVNLLGLWAPYDWVPLEILALRLVCSEPLGVCPSQPRFSSRHWFPLSLLWAAAPPCTCLAVSPNLGGQGLSRVPSLSYWILGLVFSLFNFCLLGQRGNLQASYLQNQKQKSHPFL